MYHFCTYFDRNYFTRGLALYDSLRTHCGAFNLWVLCMDDETYETLEKLSLTGVNPIVLKEFEKNDEPLSRAKQNRSRVEYYFTCTPSLPLFVLNRYPEVDLLTYLDADLFFFADPAPLFAEMAGKSIGIIGHRYPARLRDFERHGLYNVGWLSFRRDERGLECLHWWRDLCLEWCYDRFEGDRFADQKYLDRFPERYGHDIVLQHEGANVAPWNIGNYRLKIRDAKVYVNDQPLLFYHFQGFKQVMPWLYDWGLWPYGVQMSRNLMDDIYLPYIRALQGLPRGELSLKSIREKTLEKNMYIRVKKHLNRLSMFLQGMWMGKFSLIVSGRVIKF